MIACTYVNLFIIFDGIWFDVQLNLDNSCGFSITEILLIISNLSSEYICQLVDKLRLMGKSVDRGMMTFRIIKILQMVACLRILFQIETIPRGNIICTTMQRYAKN